MSLDCKTEKGRRFINAQYETTNILKNIYPSLDFIHSKNDTQEEDCWIYNNKKLFGVAEVKCRPYINRKNKIPFTLEIIKEKYDNKYLITKTKIDNLQNISLRRKIASFVFLCLPFEKKIISFKITNSKGEWIIPVESRKTRTMYSCNDHKGTIERENAFLQLDSPSVKTVSY